MFKGLSDMMSLMGKAKEMQSRMGEMQNKLAQARVRGMSGNSIGAITVEMNGKMDVLSCQIDPRLVDTADRLMLEQLLVSAMNDALFKSRKLAAEAMQEVTGGADMPGFADAMSKMGM